MENKKKTIFNVIFLLVVFTGTMYGVFHGEDIGEIVKILEQVNVLWLIPGVICVVVFIWGESIIIYYMMRTLKIRLKKWTCFLFSSVGFFFSCITPSASGGQPAQIYYMKKEKIPIPVSTLVLMIVTITYKLVLVVVGLWLVLFGQGFIHKYLWSIRHIFYLGTALNVFCVTAMLVLVFHPRLAREILVKGMALLEKLHFLHHKEARIEKLNASMAIALPLVVVLKPFLGCEFMLALHVVMLVVGILFITNFKFRKPKNLTMGAIVVIVAMAVIGILVRHYMRYMSMI